MQISDPAYISLSIEDAQPLCALIAQRERIVLFSHTAPDGDSLGSTLALMLALRVAYPQKLIQVIAPDGIDAYLEWMPRLDEVLIYLKDEHRALETVAAADLLLHVDHNDVRRLRHQPLIEAAGQSSAPRVMIDHHLEPEQGYDLYYSYPGTSSTCQLVYVLLCRMGLEYCIDEEVATLLLTGIMTDTGRFSYSCHSPQLFEHVAQLMQRGARYAYIVDALDNHTPERTLRLRGHFLSELMQIDRELGAAICLLSREDMDRLGIVKGDTEGLVNLPLSIEGVDCSCFMREDGDLVKISLRSTGSLAVNELASSAFGGGGHLNAAGAEHYGSLEEARQLFLSALRALRARSCDKM